MGMRSGSLWFSAVITRSLLVMVFGLFLDLHPIKFYPDFHLFDERR
jgi:hypothetical protein